MKQKTLRFGCALRAEEMVADATALRRECAPKRTLFYMWYQAGRTAVDRNLCAENDTSDKICSLTEAEPADIMGRKGSDSI